MSYKVVKYGKKAQRRNYSNMKYDIELPYLLEMQTSSFKQFIDEDVEKLLKDVSPIEDNQGTMRLYFEKPVFSEPERSISDTKKYDLTYSRQLTVKAKLENTLTGEISENNVVLCDLPCMTPTGTFIINGAERVIVSQIIRSSGVYYSSELDKKINKMRYTSQMIPTRGAWVELESGSKNIFYAKLDRSKKVYLTTLLRAIGLKSDEAIAHFYDKEILIDTLVKDENNTHDLAIVELYAKLRSGERVSPFNARQFIRARLFDKRRYDLGEVGRYKFNRKLDFTNRILNTTLAQDVTLKSGEKLAKNTLITKEVLDKIKASRETFRVLAIDKEDSLQNLTEDHIFAYEKNGKLYVKDHISNVSTGEIILEKDQEVTEEALKLLRRNKEVIVDEIGKYFLIGNVYEKEKAREASYVEMIRVNVIDKETEKEKTVTIVGNDQREDKLYITVSDILANVSYYLNLQDGLGSIDDIDHLGNRRLRLIGELLRNQFRIGLARTEKNIVDKMSTVLSGEVTPAGLINTTPLASAMRVFFGSSQLSQFMDQTNPLSELTQKRRISALGTGGLSRDRAGIDVRDVHNTHYGRICPIETPEGQSIGLISSLASYSSVDEYGFIQTPYLVAKQQKGKNPKITNQTKRLTASEEDGVVIASASTPLDKDGTILADRVVGRLNGETAMFDAKDVVYFDVSPKQIVSVATATIPFLEHDDASRALMGANMQRQAVPLISPESPVVGTGIEHKIAKDSGSSVVSNTSGYVTYADASLIRITNEPKEDVKVGNKTLYKKGGEFTYELAKELSDLGYTFDDEYNLINFERSNQDTCMLQKPIVKVGDFVDKGEVIADGPSTENGELALGKNVTVAFMTWEGYNYEDAIILCEDLVKDDVYTSVHIDCYEIQTKNHRQTTSKEEITRDVPNVGADAVKQLDERGIVIPGYEVNEGDILVGKIEPKGMLEPTPAERLIETIIGEKAKDFKDSSLRIPHGGGGVVQKYQYFTKKEAPLPVGVNEAIKVYVAQKRKIQAGDKMAGRHGNKGVISKILPREDMPYMADGTPIDIMLNPLGVPSRMNIGQILEIHLGYAAKKLGIKIATPVFDGVENDELLDIMKEAGVSQDGKITLYDGRTGEAFNSPISVGVMYMIKLSHMVDDKLHARAVGPYSLTTQQPMGGKAQNGGQRFGEMEVWALYAYGAAYTLQEMLTVKSDDMLGRNNVYSAITSGKELPKSSLPESFRVLTRELQALGLYVELINSETGENEVNKSLVSDRPRFRGKR